MMGDNKKEKKLWEADLMYTSFWICSSRDVNHNPEKMETWRSINSYQNINIEKIEKEEIKTKRSVERVEKEINYEEMRKK